MASEYVMGAGGSRPAPLGESNLQSSTLQIAAPLQAPASLESQRLPSSGYDVNAHSQQQNLINRTNQEMMMPNEAAAHYTTGLGINARIRQGLRQHEERLRPLKSRREIADFMLNLCKLSNV